MWKTKRSLFFVLIALLLPIGVSADDGEVTLTFAQQIAEVFADLLEFWDSVVPDSDPDVPADEGGPGIEPVG